ncbi:MAG: DUF3443 family protein [Parasulfuritortus sp.]|nr:DUF3443 family protein [Parasulfuritortus sp.]
MSVDPKRVPTVCGAGARTRLSQWGFACLLACAVAACGGGGGSSAAPATLTNSATAPSAVAGDANVVPIYVDGGPSGLPSALPNAIYADVQICAPGSTSNCAVIDHVLVDTGSVGLRLLASAVNAANASLLGTLPQASTAAGVVGECLPFASGAAWGGVRLVDMRWGGSGYNGNAALNIPIQVIGDTDPRVATTPSSCTGRGTPLQSASALGGNGVVGIGLFAQDCGAACAQTAVSIYYQCIGAGVCSPTTMPVAQQIRNPVSASASDNNGSMISLPAGMAAQASGLLVLGIGTRTNNALPTTSAVLATDPNYGYFTANFNGNSLTESFFDSGSTANFMPTTGTVSLPDCPFGTPGSSGYLCPASSVTLPTINTGQASTPTSGTANVLVINANGAFTQYPSYNVLPGLAADGGPVSVSPTLDLGASFFFGRTVATLIENQSAPGFSVNGPAFGYTP